MQPDDHEATPASDSRHCAICAKDITRTSLTKFIHDPQLFEQQVIGGS